MALRVFILDDQEVVRAGLKLFLEAEGDIEVAGEASTVAEALRRLPAVAPDVAVLDVRLPDGDGIEVCREIRSSWPSIACIMVTSHTDDEALFAAIMAGAAGYVGKELRGEALADAVRQVAAGGSLLDAASTTQVLERLRRGPAEDDRLATLSKQERRVLELIADGLTNRQIAEQMYLSEKTVKNYVSSLLGKLELDRRTEAAVFAARLEERRRGQSPS